MVNNKDSSRNNRDEVAASRRGHGDASLWASRARRRGSSAAPPPRTMRNSGRAVTAVARRRECRAKVAEEVREGNEEKGKEIGREEGGEVGEGGKGPGLVEVVAMEEARRRLAGTLPRGVDSLGAGEGGGVDVDRHPLVRVVVGSRVSRFNGWGLGEEGGGTGGASRVGGFDHCTTW